MHSQQQQIGRRLLGTLALPEVLVLVLAWTTVLFVRLSVQRAEDEPTSEGAIDAYTTCFETYYARRLTFAVAIRL